MSADKTINHLVLLLDKNFGLAYPSMPENPDINLVKERLTSVIKWLLTHDLNRLLSIFYRIDLDEKKVKEVLAFSETDLIAEKLSDLVIEREIQKAISRLKSRNQE